jgi:rhodanese-related sulfurtransferase
MGLPAQAHDREICMQQVDVETLQQWLAGGRPVTVLDIRTPEDRAQWFIPGSTQ